MEPSISASIPTRGSTIEMIRTDPLRLGQCSWNEARDRAYRAAMPLPTRSLALDSALDCVLGAPLRATEPLPARDVSAMDGYAVNGDPPWRLVRRVLAGDPVPDPLAEGEACEIATGAPLPASTHAVLPYEQAIVDGKRVSGAAVPGRHIRLVGEECAAGEDLVPAGTLVTPVTLGLAAAIGHDRLSVRSRPRVAALVTGNELQMSGNPRSGLIRDAIGPMLPGLIRAAGGEPVEVRHIPDGLAVLVSGLRVDADVVLVSGSSAIGPADHLRAALHLHRATMLVDGVRCRPGHPQTLARLPRGTLVVGLPGNPLAALAAFHTLAVAALAGLLGIGLPMLPLAVLDPAIDRQPTNTHLIPVRVHEGLAKAAGHRGPAMLRGAAHADGFAVVAPGQGLATSTQILSFHRAAMM